MFTFDMNCAPFTCDAHSDVAAGISARSRWNIPPGTTGGVRTAVEGGPRGLQGGEGPQVNEGGFNRSCWTCGGCYKSDRCEMKWLRQLERSIRRLSQGGRDESWLVDKARETVGQVRRMKTPGPSAIPIFELPRPRGKMGGGGKPVSLATRKEKRPRTRRKTKTKTMTADVVFKAQEQVMHMQEEEIRWAAVERREGMIALNSFAVDKPTGVYVLDGAGRELGVGVRSHVENSRFLVLKETYAAFVLDGTGWWDHAYWHAEGWYWGMIPSRIYKSRFWVEKARRKRQNKNRF